MVTFSLMMVLMLGFYSNPATHNARVKFFELAGFFADSRLHSLGRRYSMKSDL
jgi:hypothetical protein